MISDDLERAIRRQAQLERFGREYSAFGRVVIAAARYREEYHRRGPLGRVEWPAVLAAWEQLEAALDDVLHVLEVEGAGDATP